MSDDAYWKDRLRDASSGRAGGSSVPAYSVFQSQIRNMVDGGWQFEWDLRTGFIGACHPMGGKQTICEIHDNSYIDKDRLGLGITKMLMALGTPNKSMSVGVSAADTP